MLTPKQKYAIASTLSVQSLDSYIRKVQELPEYNAKLMRPYIDSAIKFATLIDRLFLKKNGYIPKEILELCK